MNAWIGIHLILELVLTMNLSLVFFFQDGFSMSSPRNINDAHWNLSEPIAFNHDTNLFNGEDIDDTYLHIESISR